MDYLIMKIFYLGLNMQVWSIAECRYLEDFPLGMQEHTMMIGLMRVEGGALIADQIQMIYSYFLDG